jgi:hypothetical protein
MLMRKLLLLLPLILFSGCSQNHYNVPVQNLSEQIRVLGVAPIMIDTGSDIAHPEKSQLISTLVDINRNNEHLFVRKLKSTGNFYTVALLEGDPENTFSSMLFRREKRDDASIQYNKYFWKNEELRNYIRKNNLDAVMLIVISGITKRDKVSSLTLLSSLTADYNYLIMTAQILDTNGAILWEYPNFRRRILTYSPLINLQYPDFSEAEANLYSKANVKFKNIEGIRRALQEKSKDLLMRETNEPEAYADQFDSMISFLKFDTAAAKKEPAPVTEKQSPRPAIEPVSPESAQPAALKPEMAPPPVPAQQ